MSCEIKNEKCPVQMQCLFPTTATDTRPFTLYFYSSQGSQERVLVCAYNGHHTCFQEKGFEATHEGYNAVTITVPDTFTTSNGSFGCQKGDIHMVKNCLYNPPEICNTIRSTESLIGLGTTTKGTDFPLTTEQVGNTGINPAVLGVILGSIVVIAIIIIVCLLLRKYRPKSYSRFQECLICIVPPPVIAIEKCRKYFLGKENKDNHVNQTTTDPTSFSVNGGNMERDDLLYWDDELTINALMANADQEHTSTDNENNGESWWEL
ncbi:uncharacterized protein LOC112567437 [Pomacea canaliculata]|uniref:uncharacterized protein LOC112567437 n=1 Tax=Pomacea canaliculata TaxID=400727 RepID=UPI000D727C6D|nr:uncharacterized protein LOC112567437 [Pomacea canaliculata]